MFKEESVLRQLSLPFSFSLLMFPFYLVHSLAFSVTFILSALHSPPPNPLLSSCILLKWRYTSLNLHLPPHQHQSQQIKVSSCPFSYWYSLPPDGSTDVCFYPVSLGNKKWHFSLHSRPCNPICSSSYIPVWNYRIDWRNCRLWLSSWVSGDNGSCVIHQPGQKIIRKKGAVISAQR